MGALGQFCSAGIESKFAERFRKSEFRRSAASAGHAGQIARGFGMLADAVARELPGLG
jgi:hypothetical protein